MNALVLARHAALAALALTPLLGCQADPAPVALGRRADPLFTVGPRMAGPRSLHQATRLGSGRWLVVGGGTAIVGGLNIVVTNSAEVFDPVTSTFRPVAPMSLKRILHSVSTLPDGRALVIGGAPGFTAATFTSEIYDEATDTWTPGPTPGTNHAGHAVVTLPDGNLLVVGGFARIETEVLDVKTLTFSPRAGLSKSRGMHTATLLKNGKVLVTGGGEDWTVAESSAVLYDPTTDKWNTISPMSTPRIGHTATLLPDGRVLVAGGSSKSVIGNDRLDSAELFDPTTKTFTVVGKMAHVHAFHVSILLPSGSVLIAGGNPENLLRPNSPFVERWDPKTSGFVEMAPMGSPRAAPFVVPLADGRSLITGGFGTVALASTEILTALAGGTACKSNSACESGFCRDGVCCDRACDGACEACDAKGACQFVTSGSPKAGHTCDGYACSSDAAGAGVCRESCTEDGHCATGFFCSKGKCEPDNSAKCTADHTRTRTDDGVEVSCGAYLCEDLEGGKRGRCRSQCASTGECAPGSVCNLDTASCDPGGLTPSGASCALGPADGGAPIGLVGVGAALTLAGALRRRRRA